MKFETNVEFGTTSEPAITEDDIYCSERNCSGKSTRYCAIKLGQMSMVVCMCNKHAIMADSRILLKKYGDIGIVDEYWDQKQKKVYHTVQGKR